MPARHENLHSTQAAAVFAQVAMPVPMGIRAALPLAGNTTLQLSTTSISVHAGSRRDAQERHTKSPKNSSWDCARMRKHKLHSPHHGPLTGTKCQVLPVSIVPLLPKPKAVASQKVTLHIAANRPVLACDYVPAPWQRNTKKNGADHMHNVRDPRSMQITPHRHTVHNNCGRNVSCGPGVTTAPRTQTPSPIARAV